jgi:hypothetical protein
LAVLATGLPWAVEPAGAAAGGMVKGDVIPVAPLSVGNVMRAFESMSLDEFNRMMRSGATKQTLTTSGLTQALGGVTGSGSGDKGAVGSVLRGNQVGSVGTGTKVAVPPTVATAGRVGSLVSKGGKLVGNATLAAAVFSLTYRAGAWGMSFITGIDTEGFACDFNKAVGSYALQCGEQVRYEPALAPAGYDFRAAPGKVWSSGTHVPTGTVPVFLIDSDTIIAFDMSADVLLASVGLSLLYGQTFHDFTCEMTGGCSVSHPVHRRLATQGPQVIFPPVTMNVKETHALMISKGQAVRDYLGWFWIDGGGWPVVNKARVSFQFDFGVGGEVLYNYDGDRLMWRGQCLTATGAIRHVTVEGGDVRDPQEVGGEPLVECDPGELLVRLTADLPTGDGDLREVVWEWSASEEEIERWRSVGGQTQVLSLYKVEDGKWYDCHQWPDKCSNWWTEVQTETDVTYECYYGRSLVDVGECMVYRREFTWPRTADEELTDPRDGSAVPITAGNSMVDPAESPALRAAPVAETIPVRVPQASTAPETQPQVDPFEPPPGVVVEAPVVVPGGSGGTGGHGDASDGCPPALGEWFEVFNPRWIFDGIVCALKVVFVPSDGFFEDQIGQTRQVGLTHAPMSIALAVPPVVEGLGEGWDGGCESMPDFSAVPGLKLAMGCSPPESPAWRVAWTIMVICLWVGAVLALWRMAHNAIGGRE